MGRTGIFRYHWMDLQTYMYIVTCIVVPSCATRCLSMSNTITSAFDCEHGCCGLGYQQYCCEKDDNWNPGMVFGTVLGGLAALLGLMTCTVIIIKACNQKKMRTGNADGRTSDMLQRSNTHLPDMLQRSNTHLPDMPQRSYTHLPDMLQRSNTHLPEMPQRSNTHLPDMPQRSNTHLPEMPQRSNPHQNVNHLFTSASVTLPPPYLDKPPPYIISEVDTNPTAQHMQLLSSSIHARYSDSVSVRQQPGQIRDSMQRPQSAVSLPPPYTEVVQTMAEPSQDTSLTDHDRIRY